MDAVIRLLYHRLVDDRTALSVLVDVASRRTWIIRAFDASFDLKDALTDRGCRCDPDRRGWWLEVTAAA